VGRIRSGGEIRDYSWAHGRSKAKIFAVQEVPLFPICKNAKGKLNREGGLIRWRYRPDQRRFATKTIFSGSIKISQMRPSGKKGRLKSKDQGNLDQLWKTRRAVFFKTAFARHSKSRISKREMEKKKETWTGVPPKICRDAGQKLKGVTFSMWKNSSQKIRRRCSPKDVGFEGKKARKGGEASKDHVQ